MTPERKPSETLRLAVRAAVEIAGLTAAAERSGIPKSSISGYISRGRAMPIDRVAHLLASLGWRLAITAKRRHGRKNGYANVDWRKTNHDIATERGVSAEAVAQARWLHAPETAPRRVARTDWASIDWRKPVMQIAEETGRLYTTVSMAKRRYANAARK